MNSNPLVSIIIPSLKGNKKNLARLKDTVLQSGIPRDSLEIITAIGVSPNGRARDTAVIYASGKYLICMDADVSFPTPTDLKDLIDFMENHPEVGLCGPAQQLPADLTDEIRSRSKQLPRNHVEPRDEFTESDMVTHACLCIKKDLFINLGMEHPNLISGTDPDLRHRVRKEGLKVGIVPDTRVFHPPITSWLERINTSFISGRRSRAVRRNYPEFHLNAEPDITTTDQATDMDVFSRSARHLNRLAQTVLSGQLWALTTNLSYLSGYCWELIFSTRKVNPIPYPSYPSADKTKKQEFINALKKEGTVKKLFPEGKILQKNE